MSGKISIIIPAYHEEKNICNVISEIKKKVKSPHELLVILQDREDKTFGIAQKFVSEKKFRNIHVLHSEEKFGSGVMSSIRTGVAKSQGDAIVFVMADLADDVSQIDAMSTMIQQGNDIVCASRFMKGGKKIGGPLIKTLLTRIANFTLYTISGIPTHDSTNAFKMYRREIFKNIKIESTGGFEYSLEIILKAFKKGYKIAEIPTVWNDRETGKSNFKLLSWIPQYIKWYFSIVPLYSLGCILSFLIIFFLSSLQLGNDLREKINLNSTLDFSWVSDSIERFLHGYVAGRDFIFTYGPLFQLIYSLPSVIFRLPSYISAAYAPIILVFVNSIAVIFICNNLLENKKKAFGLMVVILFLCNFISLHYANSLTRIILPLLFATIWTKFIYKNEKIFKVIFFSSLPSIFGLYTYDIFLQCLIFLISIYFYDFSKNKNVKNLIFVIFAALIWQILISFLISGGIFYTKASLNTVSDYFYIMNTVWEFARSDYLYTYVIFLIIFFIYTYKGSLTNGFKRNVLLGLFLMSLIGLRSGLVRSDAGHIELSIYESIFTLTAVLYIYIINYKKNSFIFLSCLLLLFIPFRQNYYTVLSEKNLVEVISAIKQKPQFLDIYRLPDDYYLNPGDFKNVSKFISQNKGNVMIYPYDSFLLAVNNTTYNTTALQFYDYSNSFIESESVKNLKKTPPEFIILGIDKISVVELDDIPNLTRNPILAKWIIKNYIVYRKYANFLILKFDNHKRFNHGCTAYNLHVNLMSYENMFKKIIYYVKPGIFYLYDTKSRTLIRLPVKKGVSDFFIVRNESNLNQIFALLQDQKNIEPGKITKNDILIYKVNSFTNAKYAVNKNMINLNLTCGY